ncbi:delta endotoxin C-terminal domain-containing protein [Dysgonomonas macrotermitis]|uniref:Delta endotoxin n=1 Tax=Dysgonomonas macrotermitis TaxID=1346286 RepID=A0A1M4WTG5_9BACT|nr:delta endotoxin C-terminal domain-containing protein [Dysgonomonas macrotermitis]SHE84343.1 delta endotoxin [Dysgonomonas macrotermitis]
MKKAFMSLFAAIALGTLLPSCLGDGGDSTYSGEREFAVVTRNATDNTIIEAKLSSGIRITGGDITSCSPGDAILVTYKVNFNNYIDETTIRADYATIASGDRFLSASQKRIVESPFTQTPTEDNSFTGINNPSGSYDQYFLDRWITTIGAQVQSDQNISFELYYNEDNQGLENTELAGQTLPDNTIILDAKLVKSVSDTQGSKTAKTQILVADLTTLRALNPLKITGTTSGTDMNIWLRYPKYNSNASSDDKKYTLAVIQKAFILRYYASSSN